MLGMIVLMAQAGVQIQLDAWSMVLGFETVVNKGRWSAFEVMISTEVHILNSKSIHVYVYVYIYIYISKVDT